MPAEAAMAPETLPLPPELGGLERAFVAFTDATGRLEREYDALRAEVRRLTIELEEKNRLLIESLGRERRLEAEAIRQSRLAAMGEVAAMLAHEVRNPLGAMELCVGLLQQDLRGDAGAHRLARQVARSVADLNHLVTNLLEFTRTGVARRMLVDCCALVDDALRSAADLCAAHGIRVERVGEGTAIYAAADPDLLRPVLLNLIRNAVQAMGDGGTLQTRVVEAGAWVELVVADTGPGIARTDHETIFRPFYTTRSKGTGLGLAVARELVRAMAGELTVASEVGRGAAFTVRMPAA